MSSFDKSYHGRGKMSAVDIACRDLYLYFFAATRFAGGNERERWYARPVPVPRVI